MTISLQDYARAVPYPAQKRLLSILDGYHQGFRAGRSHEFLDMAEYKAGDAISDIDWKATARFNQPIIKRFEATAVLTVILAADTGSNMAALAPGFLSGPVPKRTLAADLERVIAWLVSFHGDHLGLIAGNAAGVRTLPPRVGMGHAETLLHMASATTPDSAPPDFEEVLSRVSAVTTKRSLVLAVTDQSQITEKTAQRIRNLVMRHSVGLFLIEDYDPTGATSLGALSDVTTGRIPDFVKTDPKIAREWHLSLQAERSRAAQILNSLPIRHARIRGQEDILPSLVTVLGGR